ncbi:MAG: acyltransferase family protein [Oscillospiraceae bacterium]|nr:acyltransferase family protein [Oscillospiraceae bacterium]
MEAYLEPAAEEKTRIRKKKKHRKKAVTKRFAGIDIVKIAACFLVIAVHFFLHSGFYTTPISSEFGLPHIFMRYIAFNCVPLFMITTGYLMKNKTLSAHYYLGILRVLILYLVISAICLTFNRIVIKEQITPWGVLRGILMYTAAQYGWYVEYYFSIFFIIPFLNAGYHALQTRRDKTILLITVILLTMVSQGLYIGTEFATQIKLLPGYFARCYPIAYYLIGVYIRDYPPKRRVLPKCIELVLFLAGLIWISLTTYHQTLLNVDGGFTWQSWHFEDYAAWPVALMSTMMFLLMFDIPCKNRVIAKILQRISNATFAAYLISYVYDCIFYGRLNAKVPDIPARFAYAPATVICVFSCSIITGLILQGIYDFCAKRIQRHFARRAQQKN